MSSSTLRLLAAQILVAVGALAVVLLAYGGWEGFHARFEPACAEAVCDWQRHYLPTARALFETGEPTWGYVYPATLAVLSWPLSLHPAGTGIWIALLLIGQLALAVLPPHLMRPVPPGLALGFTAASMLGIAQLQVLSWGQPSAVLLLAGLLAFRWLQRRPILAGALIGGAVAVKLYPALLLPWLVLRRRGWALLTTGLVAVGLAVGLPILVLGPQGALDFQLAAIAELQRLVPDFQRSIGPQSAVSVTERVILGGPSSLRPLLTGAFGVVGLASLGLLWPLHRRERPDAWLWALVITYGVFPWLLASSWLHYFVHLPLIWLLLGRELLQGRPALRLGVLVMLLTSLLTGTWPAWVLLGPTLYPALGVALVSHVLGLVGVALVLLGGEAAEDPSSPVDTPAVNR